MRKIKKYFFKKIFSQTNLKFLNPKNRLTPQKVTLKIIIQKFPQNLIFLSGMCGDDVKINFLLRRLSVGGK
jgi:hypothetical protein